MSRSDVFALKNTGLNSFLFAEVGTESNGSMLTVLSVLARLGEDPWAQAAQWMRLSKPDKIDRLANSILQMPLPPQALNEARQTAARLIQLLPACSSEPAQSPLSASVPPRVPRWAPVAAIAAVLAIVIGSMVFMASSPQSSTVGPPGQPAMSPSAPAG